MLPNKVWKRYFVRDCENCEEEVNERYDECWLCADCDSCMMCEGCVESTNEYTCSVCIENEDNCHEDYGMCKHCIHHCDLCNLSFHRKCRDEHEKWHCNRESRAKRAHAKARVSLETKKEELKRAKLHVNLLEQEIEEAEVAKSEAEAELRSAQHESGGVKRPRT